MKQKNKNLLLWWDTQTGKSFEVIRLAKDEKWNKFTVVCPPKIIKQWEQRLKDSQLPRHTWQIMTYHCFTRNNKNDYGILVLDEIHNFLAQWQVGRSGKAGSIRLEKLKEHLDYHHPRLVLLSATPIRNSPHSYYTLLRLLGSQWIYQSFFYDFFEQAFPYWSTRPIWQPKSDWIKRVSLTSTNVYEISRKVFCQEIEKDILLPFKTLTLSKTEREIAEKNEWNWHDLRCYASQKSERLIALKENLSNFNKSIVFYNYTKTGDWLEKEIAKEQVVFRLDGRNNQLADFNEALCGVLVCQCATGEGWSVKGVSSQHFFELPFSVVRHNQDRGRGIIKSGEKFSIPQRYYYLNKYENNIYQDYLINKDYDNKQLH